jgi:hypothetical protein
VTFEPVDMPRLIKDCLKTALAQRFPELQVRLELPGDWQLGSPPVLIIADDGGSMERAMSASSIRVTSWTSGRDRTYVHAATGRLLAGRVPGIAAILPSSGSGVLEARDSATGGDLASVIVQAVARTR